MLVLQVVSAFILIVVVNSWDIITGWGWAMLILGSICFVVEVYITVCNFEATLFKRYLNNTNNIFNSG